MSSRRADRVSAFRPRALEPDVPSALSVRTPRERPLPSLPAVYEPDLRFFEPSSPPGEAPCFRVGRDLTPAIRVADGSGTGSGTRRRALGRSRPPPRPGSLDERCGEGPDGDRARRGPRRHRIRGRRSGRGPRGSRRIGKRCRRRQAPSQGPPASTISGRCRPRRGTPGETAGSPPGRSPPRWGGRPNASGSQGPPGEAPSPSARSP